jgi:hypothetical protein
MISTVRLAVVSFLLSTSLASAASDRELRFRHKKIKAEALAKEARKVMVLNKHENHGKIFKFQRDYVRFRC